MTVGFGKHGIGHGDVMTILNNGTLSTETWKDGLRNGKCKVKYSDGQTIVLKFKNGTQIS